MEPNRNILRALPKVDVVLEEAAAIAGLKSLSRFQLTEAVRRTLAELRAEMLAGRISAPPEREELWAKIAAAAEADLAFSLRPVINATGVVLHTNLGRAVMSAEMAERTAAIASSYSTLEYDPAAGKRGDRHSHIEKYLTRLTGGEAAMAVNNNAAALLLIMSALFRGQELIVSRGELVEIGGSFRIPDIMRQGGVKLKAVGATNRTRLDDYARAIIPDRTGGLLKVHSSNFRIIGYAGQTPAAELAGLARENNLPLVYDLGSGALIDLQPLGFHDEPSVPRALKEGADLVCFSGDKLLGGPQAGLIVGRKNHIDKLKSHPLARALRVDKMTLAALETVLRLYLDPEEAKRNIPVLAMLFAKAEDLRGRAEQLRLILAEAAPHLTFSAVPAESQTGGGAAPEKPLPSWAVAVESPNGSEVRLEEYLRLNEPPIVARTSQGRLLLDVRTIRPDQYPIIAKAFKMFAYSAWPAGS